MHTISNEIQYFLQTCILNWSALHFFDFFWMLVCIFTCKFRSDIHDFKKDVKIIIYFYLSQLGKSIPFVFTKIKVGSIYSFFFLFQYNFNHKLEAFIKKEYTKWHTNRPFDRPFSIYFHKIYLLCSVWTLYNKMVV